MITMEGLKSQTGGELLESIQRPLAERGKDSRVWRWATGVILFPEALCPNCNGAMRSTCIWRVDERGQRLLGAVRIRKDNQLVRVTKQVHPHVNGESYGHICVGNAKSATEALFLGLSQGNPYWNPSPTWLKAAFDHECSPSSRRNSRQHLTESMKLRDKAIEAEVPSPNRTAIIHW